MLTAPNTNIPKLRIKGEEIQVSQIHDIDFLTSVLSSKPDDKDSKSKKRILNTKLNYLSLSRSKCSRSDQIESIPLAPSIRSLGNINGSFSFARPQTISRTSNPFLLSYTTAKLNHMHKYNYPTLQRDESNSSKNEFDPPLSTKRHRSNISFSFTPNTASLPLKKCLSVSTLRESLGSTNKTKSTSSFKDTKKVSFTDMHIREYEVKLGDHPFCSSWPPITMGWNYIQKKNISFDSLDENDYSQRKQKAKKVDAKTRLEMLLNAGYSKAEIIESMTSKFPKYELKRSKSDATLQSSGITHEMHGRSIDLRHLKSDNLSLLRKPNVAARGA